MLPEPLQIALDLLIQFAGDGGGHRPAIVPYGIGAIFWFCLLKVARFKYSPLEVPHESLLAWGFAFALGRELLMLSVKILEAFSLLSLDQLHQVFPPAEHALSDISTVIVIAAYMLYLTKDNRFAKRYMIAGIISVVLVYLLTFWWWAEFISANPESKFGQTWCDWIFRINASFWIGVGGIYVWRVSSGWMRNYVCIAIGLFFLDDFLKIPDMALDEVYETIFAPIRHSLYLIGIIVLGYVYLREHSKSMHTAFHVLQSAVQQRNVELAEANDQLLQLSRTDPLTNLANRRAFEVDFGKLRASISRNGSSIAVMMIDIDHFKLVNDTYGHQAGDACLKAIAQTLSKNFQRNDDIIARYGGEEFIAVLANENLDSITRIAEQLREDIAIKPIAVEGHSITLTVSIGVAYRDAASTSSDETESLITLADGKLYQAKDEGRNRVCIG